MNKTLLISGPTATGKTALAVKLAKHFSGEIISADSRQIYRGMDIGTGKDHPKNTPIHLIDLINPDESFSVAQYQVIAVKLIKEIQLRGKLPIVVGGTGQYLESLINPEVKTFSIRPNHLLRFILNPLPLFILQKVYRLLDHQAYFRLNNSDVQNPHRLIRKIEIKLSLQKPTPVNSKMDFFHLSLTAPNSYLYSRIDKRVGERLKSGLLQEISHLLESFSWFDPGLNTLAYKEFKSYISNPDPSLLKKAVDIWRFDEHHLARRQKTYLKRLSPDLTIDISHSLPWVSLISRITKWYNHNYEYGTSG
ncbi:MAG: tRNA (adenosine(37)-N6)-dimethylallyltransferase MiaA [Candidatus Shapirobacteria bacterium]|jgi:tRNA dimethylallyltransferase